MKLIRFGDFQKEKPGLLLADGTMVDVSQQVDDYDEAFFSSNGPGRLEKLVEDSANLPVIPANTRLGAPIKRPGKLICIGLNYRKHAMESGMDIPKEPIIFFKATSAIVGPFDKVVIPRNSQKTDWEVELAVVIGKKASYVSEEEAMNHVAGYVLHNDISEREFQLERGGQWVKGKSADTFAPLGPFIATADEITDPHNLQLWLKVNETRHQNGNTSDFIFNIPYLISYLSQFMSLMPGDIISTGTPEGVGLGYKPSKFLKAGDVMELGIEGLGESRQEVVAYSS